MPGTFCDDLFKQPLKAFPRRETLLLLKGGKEGKLGN